MALLRIDHTPETTKVCMPLYVIAPEPYDLKKKPLQSRTVLYLLHGLSDDASAWSRFSSIETIARDYGLMVVMPSVGRSFYVDLPNGQRYFSYVAEELPMYLRELFGIEPKRENTLVAGLSMGGYGVLKLALNYPERFFAAATFSGLTSLEMLNRYPDDPRNAEFSTVFGELSRLPGSEHDPSIWLQRAAKNPEILPRLYCACGRQDDLYPINQAFRQACQRLGIPLDYFEEEGKHDWYFWDRHIKLFLQYVLGEPHG